MALIKLIEEFKEIIPVTVASTIEPLKSDIALAEEMFLIPEIGYEQYNIINVDNPTKLSADLQELVKKCQRTVAYYAWMLNIPKAQLQFSDSGIRIASTEHFKTAFDWQIDNLEEATRNAGDVTMELLLTYMESKKAVFTEWAGSATFTQFKERFVQSAEELNKHVANPIKRRKFRRLRVELRNSELWFIKPVTGAALFDELHTQNTAGNLSAANLKLMDFILPACSNLAMASGISALSVDINDLGTNSGTNGMLQVKIRKEAGENTLANLIDKYDKDGGRHVKDLQQFLYDNKDDYPLFTASTAYEVTRQTTFDNTIDKKHFMV